MPEESVVTEDQTEIGGFKPDFAKESPYEGAPADFFEKEILGQQKRC